MDAVGRLKQVDELNWNQSVYSTTTYIYNVRDQITQINQAGQIRSFAYDGHGRLQTRTTPEQGATSYSYFADDTVQTITDARGATMTFSYNQRHLVTGINFGVTGNVAATPNVSFGYDAAGNRTSMTDGLGSKSYVYDQLSRMTSETRTFANMQGSYTLSYTYNLASELKSITNQSGAQVAYNYDAAGRPASISGSGYAGVSSYVNNLSYRAFGLKQISYPNNRTLSLQYDNRMRPTLWSIPGVLRMQYSYTWEQSGRLEFARNPDDETLDRYFAYDHAVRLIVSRSGNEARLAIGEEDVQLVYNGPYSHNYHYDQWGNVTSREGWGGPNPQWEPSYTNNKIDGVGYDQAGNMINAGGGLTFTYDATGQQVTSSTGTMVNGYDGDRLRGKKTENQVTTYYLRSTVLGGQVVAELDHNGNWVRGYVYLGGELLAVQQNASVNWVHQDPLVKSKRVTNSAGTVVSSVELDPWGGEVNHLSNLNQAFQPKKFTSYTRDALGSDDAMHRRYNSGSTRFEQPDPYDGSYDFTNPQSFNRYAYVQNDPVNFVDPLGPPPPVPTLIPYGGTIVTNTLAPYYSGSSIITGTGIFDGDLHQSLTLINFQQNRVPLPSSDAIRNRLNTGDCNAYIASLIAKANNLYGGDGNVAVAKDGLDLLKQISGQGGFVSKDFLKINRWPVGGTVSGSIAEGTGTVLISTRFMLGNRASTISMWQADYINTAIHEMLHLARKYSGYDDRQLATAASKLPGAAPGLPAPPKDYNDMPGILSNSGYFDAELKKHCGGN
jgi:RHS repeat-associated protein